MEKVVAPEMSLHALGVRVGLLMFATVFFSFAVGEGSGSFWAGASHAFLGLLLYGFGYAVISTLAALAAVGLGRLVGTKVAFALSLNAMLVLSFWAWLSAQPVPMFKRLVWREMPPSVMILDYEKKSSFSDGSTDVFKMAADAGIVREMGHALGLEQRYRHSMEIIGGYVPEEVLAEGTTFFGRPGLEVVMSGKQVFVVRMPALDTEPESSR